MSSNESTRYRTWLDPYRSLFLLLGVGIAMLWRRRRVPMAACSWRLLLTPPWPCSAHRPLPISPSGRWSGAIHRPSTGRTTRRPSWSWAAAMSPVDAATRLRAERGRALRSSMPTWPSQSTVGEDPARVVLVRRKEGSFRTIHPAARPAHAGVPPPAGVNQEDIIVEDAVTETTHENAVECRELLKNQPAASAR